MGNIFDVAKMINVDEKYLIPFGYDKAKISLKIMDELKDRPNGKLVLVTAITPTKAGEGKTTTSIGLVALLVVAKLLLFQVKISTYTSQVTCTP